MVADDAMKNDVSAESPTSVLEDEVLFLLFFNGVYFSFNCFYCLVLGGMREIGGK